MRDELIKKVAQAIKNVWLADRDDSFDWTAMAWAAIDELAKATDDDLTLANVAAILVAQRARIEELEQRGDRVVELEFTNDGNRQRISELEKFLAHTNPHGLGHARPMTTAEEASFAPIQERILSREYHTDGQFPSVDAVVDAAMAAEIRFSWTPDAAFVYDYLRRRLVEQNTPVDATGKTPVDVYRDAHEAHYSKSTEEADEEDFARIYRESEDVAIQAVIRTFGNGAEALRMVRERIDGAERMSNDTEYGKQWVSHAEVLSIIDDELAKLQ